MQSRPWFALVLLGPLLVGVAGCAGAPQTRLSTAPPGLNVARAALSGHAPAVALDIANDHLRRDPDDTDALLLQGDALVELGQDGAAATAYQRVLQLSPGQPEAELGLGRLLLATDPAAAERAFLESLARIPRDARALNDLGIARDLQGRRADAQDAYRRALGIAPAMQAATANLAMSLALSGHASEALAILRPVADAPDGSTQARDMMATIAAMRDGGAAPAAIATRPPP